MWYPVKESNFDYNRQRVVSCQLNEPGMKMLDERADLEPASVGFRQRPISAPVFAVLNDLSK